MESAHDYQFTYGFVEARIYLAPSDGLLAPKGSCGPNWAVFMLHGRRHPQHDGINTANHEGRLHASVETEVRCLALFLSRHTEFVASPATYCVVTALSHTGLVRDHNEDSLVIGQWTLCAAETQTPQTLVFPIASPLVVAVADGLGGHPGGDVASSLVVRELARAGPTLDGEQGLRNALTSCNRALYGIAADEPTFTAMGTTVAGALFMADQLLAFNIGDSRVYSHGPDGLRQVSVDDRPPLARGQEHTAIVTQTLGGGLTYADVEPHLSSFPPSTDVRWLICSDGLSDLVDNQTLSDLLLEPEDSRAAFELWKAAMEAGGLDNITLALVRVAG